MHNILLFLFHLKILNLVKLLTHSVQIRKMLSLLRPVTYLVQIHHNSCRQNNLFYYLSVQNTDLLPDYSSSEHWIMLLPTGYFFIRFQMFSTSLFTLPLCTNLKYTQAWYKSNKNVWISNRYVIPSSSQSLDPGFIVIYWTVAQMFEVYGFCGASVVQGNYWSLHWHIQTSTQAIKTSLDRSVTSSSYVLNVLGSCRRSH